MNRNTNDATALSESVHQYDNERSGRTTPDEVLRSVLESICAAAHAQLESTGGLCGFPTEEELFASRVIYLAQDGLDRLDEIKEEEGNR